MGFFFFNKNRNEDKFSWFWFIDTDRKSWKICIWCLFLGGLRGPWEGLKEMSCWDTGLCVVLSESRRVYKTRDRWNRTEEFLQMSRLRAPEQCWAPEVLSQILDRAACQKYQSEAQFRWIKGDNRLTAHVCKEIQPSFCADCIILAYHLQLFLQPQLWDSDPQQRLWPLNLCTPLGAVIVSVTEPFWAHIRRLIFFLVRKGN